LTIKSTSHTTLVDATFFALTLVFCNARQYSIVKDLDFVRSQKTGAGILFPTCVCWLLTSDFGGPG